MMSMFRSTRFPTLVLLLASLVWLLATPPVPGATFTVNDPGDVGDLVIGDGLCDSGFGSCTLRAAVLEANALPGVDTIAFDLPAPFTVALTSALPRVNDPVVIDGATQPGWTGTPIVEIDGSAVATGDGFTMDAGGSTLRGLVVRDFPGHGIALGTGSQNLVEGSALLHNGVDGLSIGFGSTRNRIGGTTPETRNVISGNGSDGIQIFADAHDNVIEGNFVGTDASGTAALPNAQIGIALLFVSGNRIGGTADGAGNLISGNGGSGIQIRGLTATNNSVEGNRIGTDVDGLQALPNSIGVQVSGAPGNRIGGTELGARSLISGNQGAGVLLTGADSTGNIVEGNWIGTDATGLTSLGNGEGVRINGPANRVGGSDPRAGNVVSASTFSGIAIVGHSGSRIEGNLVGTDITGSGALGNGADGVVVIDSSDNVIVDNVVAWNAAEGVQIGSGSGNQILGTSIFGNGGLGIDLGTPGVDVNDVGDADTGANGLQNQPVLTAVSSTVAQGVLDSLADKDFTLELFASVACDPSGFGEGAEPRGSTVVRTDATGQVAFAVSLHPPAATGAVLTATATGADGTSEFSACLVVEGLDVVIDIKPGSDPNSIQLGSNGTVPVAILSSLDFDATTVAPGTVTLASAPVKLRGRGTAMASEEDINGDGLFDLVVHVETEALALTDADEEAILEGETFSGVTVRGADSVRVVP